MTQNQVPQEPIDPRLEQLLDSFRSTPPRDPEAAQRGWAKYLSEVDELIEQQQPVTWRQRLAAWILGGQSSRRTSPLNVFRQKAAYTSLVTIVAILVVLFSGASITAYAAQDALPGDALYSVKTNLEGARVNLSRDAANKAQLHLTFAERRLDEIARLIGDGRFNDIGTATREFEYHTQAAIDSLITVAAGDPAGARDLAMQISSSLTRYAQTLSGMVASVPDAIKPEMERAIGASTTGSFVTQGEVEFSGVVESTALEVWVVSGRTITISAETEIKGAFTTGNTVKVHARIAADGSLIARQIEAANLAGEGDHVNDNSNQNDNSTGNTNDDENTNQNEQHGGESRFIGVVESIDAEFWVVSGEHIAITAQTEIRDVIQIGDLVEVRAERTADGSLAALRLEMADAGNANLGAEDSANQNNNENQNQQQGSEVRFTGTLELKSGSTWQIGGRSIRITPQTEVRGNPSVGSSVEVRALRGADGMLIAVRIEQKDSDSGGSNNNLNSNVNDNSNTNGNTNTNTNGNDNSNQSGSGGGGGSGSGGGNDNQNTNQNSNSNDNGSN